MKFARLDSCIKSFAEVENANLLKVKLSIQHDGANKNGTKFSLENIKKAESTLRNIPILAYIKRDEDGEAQDFDQHNMIQRVVETDEGYDLVTTYLERPIGVIPTETEITYEVMDGRTYLCATGYIWKRYANEGFDILMQSEQKGTSMEIEIYNGKKDKVDGLYEIMDYGFLGVTCLGDDVESGMFNTTITKYTTSKSYKRELEDIYKEIFTLENGKEDIMTNEVKEVVEAIEEAVKVEEEVIAEETIVEETKEEQSAEATTEEVVEEKANEVEEVEPKEEEETEIFTEEVKEEKTEVVEETKEEVIEEKADEIEEATEEVVEEVKEEKAEFSIDELVEKLGAKELEINSLMDIIANYEKELNCLREFKAVKEHEALEAEVNVIADKFNTLDNADIEVVKTRVLNNEITIAEFEKELYYLVGVKALEAKANYTVSEPTGVAVTRVIPIVEEKEQVDEYDGLLKKHKMM